MSKYTAIADAGEYLVKLLRQFCVPDPVQTEDKIGLVSDDNSRGLALSLRLVDIQAMNINQFKANCVPLCLSYVLTAHSNAIPEQRALEEYKILGKAISVLAENPAIFSGTEFLSSDDTNVSILFENIDTNEYKRSSDDIKGAFVLYKVSPILIDTAGKKAAPRVRSTG